MSQCMPGQRERSLRHRFARRIVGLLLLSMVLSIIHVWSRMEVLNLRYALSAVDKQIEATAKVIERLESAIAQQKSMERLMRVAQETIGLASPSEGQVIHIQERAVVVAHP